MKCLSTSGRVRARQFCRLASNPWASFSSLLLSKVLLDSLLRSKSRRFVPVGRTPIFALRAVSSQRLRSETLVVRRQWDSVSLVPDQTDRRKAPSSGLLGLSARSAASAAMPLRAVLRARGHRAHVVLASRPKQRPSLLGPSARSAPAARRSGRMRLTGEGSATPPRVPLPSKLRAASFFLNLKFYSIFFKKLRGRGAEPPLPAGNLIIRMCKR